MKIDDKFSDKKLQDDIKRRKVKKYYLPIKVK